MARYLLTLDQGTTSSRAIIFDGQAEIVALAQKEFRQIYPRPGWIEHDAEEIWHSQYHVTKQALEKAGLGSADIAAMGITNQRETTVVWDRDTGHPIHNAIVWQDRRTADYCNQLKEKPGYAAMIREKTGLVIDAYFSASKVKWLLDHVPGAREKARAGKLCFGTIDSWLIYCFSGGRTHVTDVSNAARTMLFNIHTLKWDTDLLQLFDIPSAILPEVCSNSGEIATTTPALFTHRMPIAGMAGDQQAALFGQMCLHEGMLKTTYGTGCFMVMNTGHKPRESANHLLTTVAWQLDGHTTYALEGSIFIGGAIIQWLRDELGLIRHAGESEELATSVDDNGGVYVVPALTGLGAPHWDQSARGTIVGLTRGSSRAHITRAALESIAYQVHDIARAQESDVGIDIPEMRVDGGAVVNDFLMQFQADILGTRVVRPTMLETTALGVAYLAGLGVGHWNSIEELQSCWAAGSAFEPRHDNSTTSQLLHNWNRALLRAKGWHEE